VAAGGGGSGGGSGFGYASETESGGGPGFGGFRGHRITDESVEPAKRFSWNKPPGDDHVPVVVRYAPMPAWQQRTVWISKECNSDNFKWHMIGLLEAPPSVWRVQEGFSGMPYDRCGPLVNEPPAASTASVSRLNACHGSPPLVIAPSFGP
jgi:hypothetical protein